MAKRGRPRKTPRPEYPIGTLLDGWITSIWSVEGDPSGFRFQLAGSKDTIVLANGVDFFETAEVGAKGQIKKYPAVGGDLDYWCFQRTG